jgi:hypothetical protein
VHNIRIEWLWVDVTSGFGAKWKTFFQQLEYHNGLDTANPDHLWLLHSLFLATINAEAESWVATGNNHVLERRGQANQTPSQLYTQGMIMHGVRGVTVMEFPLDEDIEGFGTLVSTIPNHDFRTFALD